MKKCTSIGTGPSAARAAQRLVLALVTLVASSSLEAKTLRAPSAAPAEEATPAPAVASPQGATSGGAEASATPTTIESDPDLAGRRFFLVRYGLQFDHESADFAQTKIASFAYGNALSRWWVYQLEVGGWADKGNGGAKNLKGSFYTAASIGVEVLLETVFARILVGPTLISHTDARLSTNFQIHHEFSLGIRGKNGLGIGLFLKHFSNGGIRLPNESRDLYGFLVQFPM
jgi:hypothetical protein